jgi:hypothetical protein
MRVLQGLCISLILATTSGAASAQGAGVTPAEARAIAVSAYLYFYPLVTMDVTRRQSTTVVPGSHFGAPMNTFLNAPAYPDARFRVIVRPNFDTLYSSAWLDLTHGPVVLSVPDTRGRYYLMPMMDMWTDVFASPGWRTTGTQPGLFLIAPPAWSGTVPDGMTRIDAPTPYVWILGRTQTNGPADYMAVHDIQKGYVLTPLSQWGKAPGTPALTNDPTIDMKTPPKEQVDEMSGAQFFRYAADLLIVNPPHLTDEPMIALLQRIGFRPGKSFDVDALDPAIQVALAAAPATAQKLMIEQGRGMATIENGWQMNLDTIGVYGNNYVKRAIVARSALGANVPDDAIYPFNLYDDTKKPLDGAHAYTMHFAAGAYPPAKAFWSITLYDNAGYPVANQLDRYTLSSWMPLVKNADGSLDLYFQSSDPGAAKDANWLPTPPGPFNLTMRLYVPGEAVLYGQWAPPLVIRRNAGGTPG